MVSVCVDYNYLRPGGPHLPVRVPAGRGASALHVGGRRFSKCPIVVLMPTARNNAPAKACEHDFPEKLSLAPGAEKRENVVRFGFAGNADTFEQFCRLVEEAAPPGTTKSLNNRSLAAR